ncbi:MAG: chemotaxis protein CheB [Myxococcota bacterium]
MAHPERIVAIGASAGGLDAIVKFFARVPTDSGLSFVVIQHLAPDFRSVMDELIGRHTDLAIQVIEDGMPIERDSIYLIPPRSTLTVSDYVLHLEDYTNSPELNLPIDSFFQSLAEDQGESAIGIVLSGTGSDGTRGARSIKEEGGLLIVQDPESAQFDGMPRSAIAVGVDFVTTPSEMPQKLMTFLGHPYVRPQPGNTSRVAATKLDRVLSILIRRSGADYSLYKPTTIGRRVERRMVIHQIEDLDDYIDFLEESPTEHSILAREVLIGVTRFFRDKDTWTYLRERVLPDMLSTEESDHELRFWIAATSTGEEAYSLAMLLHDLTEQLGSERRYKIFATDIDKNAIDFAGQGLYPQSAAADLPREYLTRYFSRQGDYLEIIRPIREKVVFAPHNLLKDPPFTRLDMISCRNAMIYFQTLAQRKLLSLFHFGLRADGRLLLGTSETTGALENAYETISGTHHYFRKSSTAQIPVLRQGAEADMDSRLSAPAARSVMGGRQGGVDGSATAQLATEFVMERLNPTGMVLTKQMELVHVIGDVSEYLRIGGGVFSSQVAKLAIEPLRVPLSTALYRASRGNTPIIYRNIQCGDKENPKFTTLEVHLVEDKERAIEYLIALFRSEGSGAPLDFETDIDANSAREQQMADLASQLHQTRENLQATIEELETSNEELQSSNEELLAANEELQSTNEELHSVNEELFTVNEEYQGKISALVAMTNDFDNLLRNTEIGILFLDTELRIRRYTPTAADFLRLVEHDIGREIAAFRRSVPGLDLDHTAQEVMSTRVPVSMTTVTDVGSDVLVNVLPFVTADNLVDGAVVTLTDVSDLQEAARAVEESERRLSLALEAGGISTWVWVPDEDRFEWDGQRAGLHGITTEESAGGVADFMAAIHPDDVNRIRFALEASSKNPSIGFSERYRVVRDGTGEHHISSRARSFSDGNLGHRIVGVSIDETSHVEIRETLESRATDLMEFASSVSHEVSAPVRSLSILQDRLKQHLSGSLEQEGERIFELMRAETDYAYRLTKELARYYRLSNYEYAFLHTESRDAVGLAIAGVASRLEALGATISKKTPMPAVEADPSQLKVLFDALFENALDRGLGRELEIQVSAEEDADGWIFDLSDNGPPMDEALIATLFEPVLHLDASTKSSGRGLAVPVARKIVAAHGGRIWAENVGERNHIRFTLPREHRVVSRDEE